MERRYRIFAKCGLRNIHARDVDLKYSNVFDRIQSRMIVFSIHLEG